MALFSKYSGAGNDFVIIRGEELGLGDAAALAERLCSRRSGVGVDGMIIVRSVSEDIVRVRFFNPDGSEFATCGNGSRCAAKYSADRGLTGDELMMVTDDGEIRARVSGTDVVLDYALDPEILDRLEVEVAGDARPARLVRMGTPHLVVDVDDVDLADFALAAGRLRHLPELGPEGANVDFVSEDGGRFRIRTFERGVEAETLACGSGCMATAFALRQDERAAGPVELETRSGEILRVEFLPEGFIRLAGPARHVFDGVLPDRAE
jgi:diaminopimelate epimerase